MGDLNDNSRFMHHEETFAQIDFAKKPTIIKDNEQFSKTQKSRQPPEVYKVNKKKGLQEQRLFADD